MESQTLDPVVESAGNVAKQAGVKVDQALDMARQSATSRLESERERIADGVYSSAHALRQVGQQLREQDQDTIANLADQAAQRAEDTSAYLRSKELPQILEDTEQLGRAHPLLFTGAALGLGLLGVRFLKSSRRQQSTVPLQLPASFDHSTASSSAMAQMRKDQGKSQQSSATATAGGKLPNPAAATPDKTQRMSGTDQSGFATTPTSSKLPNAHDNAPSTHDTELANEASRMSGMQGKTTGS